MFVALEVIKWWLIGNLAFFALAIECAHRREHKKRPRHRVGDRA